MKHKIVLLMLTLILGAGVAFAQSPQAATTANVAGKYEGMLTGPDERVSLELKSEAGKISGRFLRGETAMDVSEGKLEGAELSLSFGLETLLRGKVEADKIVGDLVVGTHKRSIELKRITSAAPAAAAAPLDLSGNWDAIADANGQAFPFALKLKIEGQNVSGSGSSQLGESTITSGTWKDGRLVFQLEGSNGAISMSAIVIDGKLSGEFDVAGQVQGKWVAVKKD